MAEKIYMYVIIGIILCILITALFTYLVAKEGNNNPYVSVINPSTTDFTKIVNDSNVKKRKKELEKEEKKRKRAEDSELGKKFKNWYIQAGKPEKNINDFIKTELLMLFTGLLMIFVFLLTMHNFWIGFAIAVVALLFPVLDLAGDISERKASFRKDFAYFLQTLSFVLSNGGVLQASFVEVTNKQEEGVLKEIMKEVIVAQKVNGGDFSKAFSTIAEKIQIDETKEFVEIIQNNLAKGIPVAETFASQSESISRYTRNKKTKKIRNMSNTIILPIFFVIGAIGILFA